MAPAKVVGAAAVERAVIQVSRTLDSLAAGRMGASTNQVGDRVVEAVRRLGE